jgi:hypothetical protein
VISQTYHFEIKDVLTQFIAAFDDIVIKRFNKKREPEANIHVRYVYSPKQRVLFDIVNRAQNITIPVVAVSINSVQRDESRVFNKIEGFYYTHGELDKDYQRNSIHYKTPVPVNINISMSIVARFQSDMDQILSNFIPYNNPYIIISWKTPDTVVSTGFKVPQEIRSEVLWDGTMNLTYPTDINASEKYKVIGDTTFTIKAWLFAAPLDPIGNIFYIDNNFHNSRNVTLYEDLSGNTFAYPLTSNLVNDKDVISVNGYPQVTRTIEQNL